MSPQWSEKDQRQFEHVKESELELGRTPSRAKAIAGRTVNQHRRREGRTPSRRSQGTGNPSAALEERTANQLRNRARQLGIEGRSEMSKAELVAAIRRHG